MYKKLYLSSLALSLTIVSASVNSALPIELQDISYEKLQQNFQLMMPGTKRSMRMTSDGLKFVKQHTDVRRVMHTRLQQQYAGFLVYGGYAILHQAGHEVKMNGTVYQGLEKELGQPAPTFQKNASLALQEFKHQYQHEALSEEQVTPIVYIDDNHQAHWAYKVSVLITPEDNIPKQPTAILDANTYKPFLEWNGLKTLRSIVKGRGYGGNARIGKFEYGKEFPLLRILRDNAAPICYMENKDVIVVDMAHRYNAPNTAMRFSCGEPEQTSSISYWTGYQEDGYDLENGAFSPTNDALFAGQVIRNMYKEWFDLDVLVNPLGDPMRLVMRVHYGQGYDNAFWDGSRMTFGDGGEEAYPLVSIGVAAHEISHGFTEQFSNLEYIGQSGGMNESFSDMAAQAAEFYAYGKNSWEIGSDVLKQGAIRYLDDPSRDGQSIVKADEYTSGIDVHQSSGVYNHLFYLLVSQSHWSVKQAFHLMVKANMDYWTPYANFNDGGCGLIHAAKDLGYSIEDVHHALIGVAIDGSNCDIPKKDA